jgi:DNA helicase-2/ATP-dependent DNA helicase PcrA
VDLLSNLNPAQREAVTQVEGPVLVLAGAGSGKTRVLTHRIAYLVGKMGVSPEHILAVTFTNKAAGEMKNRVLGLLAREGVNIQMGTFHSICARILRREGHRLGYERSFSIYDEPDQLSLIKRVQEELGIPADRFSPKGFRARIEGAKHNLMTPGQFEEQALDDYEKKTALVYQRYQTALESHNAMDFGDLINKVVFLFQLHPRILARYQERFQYVLVDEYQDTNHAQYMLVNLLASRHRNLCVVGDDDQSIYGWRGADIGNILSFEKDYPDTHVVKLEQNYRSTQNILTAASHVVAHNRGRKEKTLWTEQDSGRSITLLEALDEQTEALTVLDKIQAERSREGRELFDFAVLYRINAQSRTFEDQLRRAGLPYVIVGGVRFYERKEVKDILAYLRVLVNPIDSVSLRRIINVPRRGIGPTTLGKLEALAAERGVSLLKAVRMAAASEELPAGLREKLSEFHGLFASLADRLEKLEVSEVVQEVIERTGYLRDLVAEGTVEAQTRAENVRELVVAAEEFAMRNEEATLLDFLEEVSLLTSVDTWDSSANAITLMTLHSAKGLEFPVIFIAGLEEGLFPLSRAMESQQELEEERRLMYVGMTRAKEKLYLSRAHWRRRWGSGMGTLPSRFLEEVPAELIEVEGYGLGDLAAAGGGRTAGEGRATHRTYDDDDEFAPRVCIGSVVRHPTFGIGRVMELSGYADDLKLTISFGGQTPKKILAKYAQLEILR